MTDIVEFLKKIAKELDVQAEGTRTHRVVVNAPHSPFFLIISTGSEVPYDSCAGSGNTIEDAIESHATALKRQRLVKLEAQRLFKGYFSSVL